MFHVKDLCTFVKPVIIFIFLTSVLVYLPISAFFLFQMQMNIVNWMLNIQKVLPVQIPLHSICLKSLKRVSEIKMFKNVFQNLMSDKIRVRGHSG